MNDDSNLVASNNKAHFHYEIIETLEVGIALRGSEIKSIRQNTVTIAEAWIQVISDELSIRGMLIPTYKQASFDVPDPSRTRRLLAHKKQIIQLANSIDRKGMTIIPLKLYFKRGRLKLLIGLGRGKSNIDKRSDIKERDEKRRIQRAMQKPID